IGGKDDVACSHLETALSEVQAGCAGAVVRIVGTECRVPGYGDGTVGEVERSTLGVQKEVRPSCCAVSRHGECGIGEVDASSQGLNLGDAVESERACSIREDGPGSADGGGDGTVAG